MKLSHYTFVVRIQAVPTPEGRAADPDARLFEHRGEVPAIIMQQWHHGPGGKEVPLRAQAAAGIDAIMDKLYQEGMDWDG